MTFGVCCSIARKTADSIETACVLLRKHNIFNIHETPLLKCFYLPAGLNLPTNKEKLIIIMCFLLKAGSHFTTNTWPWPCLPQLNLKGFIPKHCITILEEKKKVWSHTCSLRNVTVSESHIPTLIVTHNCLEAGFPFRKCMVCLNLTHVTYSHVEVLLIVIIPPLHTSCEEIHS